MVNNINKKIFISSLHFSSPKGTIDNTGLKTV